MPRRSFTAQTSYRYGFNGKEKDLDINSSAVAFEARIYDSRIGRFFSTDPAIRYFINNTPYNFAGNNPIQFIDANGAFKLTKKMEELLKNEYPELYKFITSSEGIAKFAENPKVVAAFERRGYSKKELLDDFAYGKGAYITFKQINVDIRFPKEHQAKGKTPDKNNIWVDNWILEILKESKSDVDIEAAMFGIFFEILHESGHRVSRIKYNNDPNGYTRGGIEEDGVSLIKSTLGSNANGIMSGVSIMWTKETEFKKNQLSASKRALDNLRSEKQSDLIPNFKATKNNKSNTNSQSNVYIQSDNSSQSNNDLKSKRNFTLNY